MNVGRRSPVAAVLGRATQAAGELLEPGRRGPRRALSATCFCGALDVDLDRPLLDQEGGRAERPLAADDLALLEVPADDRRWRSTGGTAARRPRRRGGRRRAGARSAPRPSTGVGRRVISFQGSASTTDAVGQGPGRARDHALAARDARRAAHRVVEVEGDPRLVPLAHPADDLVVADVVAAPDAAVAEDAGVVVDGDDQRRVVLRPRGSRRGEPGRRRPRTAAPAPRARSRRVCVSLAQGDGWSAISSSVSIVTADRIRSPRPRGRASAMVWTSIVSSTRCWQAGKSFRSVCDLAALHLGDLDHAEPADGHRVHVVAVAEDRDRVAPGRVLEELRRGVVDRGGRGMTRPCVVLEEVALRVGRGDGLLDGDRRGRRSSGSRRGRSRRR